MEETCKELGVKLLLAVWCLLFRERMGLIMG